MELNDYLKVLKNWWWLIIACVVIASGASYVGTLNMARIYQATTTVMIGQSLQRANPNSQDLWISQQLAQTYAAVVKRRPILKDAAEALGLNFIPNPANISTRQVEGTQLLEISVRDTDAERARALADEIANQLKLQSPTSNSEQERQSFVDAQLQDIETKIEATQSEIESEQGKLETANSARAIQQHQSNISALQQKLFSYQQNYAALLMTVQGGTNYISVIEPAIPPSYPISPNVPQTVILGAAVGLALGLGGAFLSELLDDTVKTPDDVNRVTNLPTLGTIAAMNGNAPEDRLIVEHQPLSTISESYRVLRTNIQFSFVDKPMRTICVTSPGPSEGKSVTLANLAVSMAQSGLKVVAVDSDLRRPTIHKIFNLSNELGLSHAAVHHDRCVTDNLQETNIENLWVMTSGPLPPNPAEILGSERMKEILEELQTFADLVLFDTPPALVVTDAVVLATRVDGVVLVNDAGATRRIMARRAAEELRRVRANVIGVVLNRMKLQDGSYYYQYYYYDEQGHPKRRAHRKLGLLRWLPWGDKNPSTHSESVTQ
ncbi:MAG: polysaccharide biosynthesis tyrosine autokinase [Anaerolineae bacterium]|nr:polysaccharide biosynthesis tyrosine autokinase [Anaerolineae bacterium]